MWRVEHPVMLSEAEASARDLVVVIVPVVPAVFAVSLCHFLKQVDYFSLVDERKEDSC